MLQAERRCRDAKGKRKYKARAMPDLQVPASVSMPTAISRTA